MKAALDRVSGSLWLHSSSSTFTPFASFHRLLTVAMAASFTDIKSRSCAARVRLHFRACVRIRVHFPNHFNNTTSSLIQPRPTCFRHCASRFRYERNELKGIARMNRLRTKGRLTLSLLLPCHIAHLPCTCVFKRVSVLSVCFYSTAWPQAVFEDSKVR